MKDLISRRRENDSPFPFYLAMSGMCVITTFPYEKTNLSRADRQMLGPSCLITSQKGIHVLYSTCLDVLCTLYFKIKVLIPKQICEAKVVILFLRPLQLAQILHLHPGRSATVDH